MTPYLEAAIGKRAAQLATVAPARQGARTDVTATSRAACEKLTPRRETALRAILRAPEPIQARAVRRCGELLREVEPARGGVREGAGRPSTDGKSTGGRPPVDSAPPTRTSVAESAGLSERAP